MSFRSRRRPILLFKDCFDKFLYAWKLEEVSVVEQIITSNKMITAAIQVERDHYKFWPLLKFMNRLREVTAGGYAMLCVILRLLWHDGWWKTAPCWLLTTMSSGCFSWCSLLIPWKSKVTKTQSEVSNEYQFRWCKLLDNYLHQDLPENEPTITSTTKECTKVEGRVTKTNSKATVRGLKSYYPASLWHTSAPRNCLKLN